MRKSIFTEVKFLFIIFALAIDRYIKSTIYMSLFLELHEFSLVIQCFPIKEPVLLCLSH